MRVKLETELLKPVSDLLHRGSAPDYRASSPRIAKTTRQIPNAVGSIFLASSRARALARRQIAVPDRCQLPEPRGRPCARARGRSVPPEAPPRRNAPAASAGATQAGKGQPAGLKPLNASRARWFDSPRSSRPRFDPCGSRATSRSISGRACAIPIFPGPVAQRLGPTTGSASVNLSG